MSRKRDALFEFIKLLDPVEIRDVYQFAGPQGKERNHMRLFAVLCRMEEYDPSLIEKEFAGEPVLNHLSRVKNYLYNFIFKALTAYYRLPNADLEDLIRQVNIAQSKGKYFKALEFIEKAKEIAKVRERFADWINLLKTERKILLILPNFEHLEQKLDEIREELRKATTMLENLNQYEVLEDDLVKRARLKYYRRGIRDPWLAGTLDNEPLMSGPGKALSYRARLKYFHNHFEIARAKGDFEQCIVASQNAIELIETYPFLAEEHKDSYLIELARIGTAYLALDNIEECLSYIHKLRTKQASGAFEKINLLKLTAVLELSYSSRTQDWGPGKNAVAKMEELYDHFFPELREEDVVLLHWLATRFFFQKGDYYKANTWIHRFINQNIKGIRVDLEITLRVLHLLILFEQSDWEGIDYYSRRHLRFIGSLEEVNRFESSLIRFLKKVPAHLHAGQLQQGLMDFKAELVEIFQDPKEQYFLNYFDIMEWLDQRIIEHTHITLN